MIPGIYSAAENTHYFALQPVAAAAEAERAFIRGEVVFIVTIPAGFTQKILRQEKPQLLIQSDAIDPPIGSNALNAITHASKTLFEHDLPEALRGEEKGEAFELVIHRMFNPEGITQYSTIPGIMGSILGTTMILMTALSITRERESGAFETLLASPVNGQEVCMGKIAPYVLIGLVQLVVILFCAVYLFSVPLLGNLFLLLTMLLIYIFLCLSIGITISSIAKTQLQALQMSSLYFIPSLLLSISMPAWAQFVGACLPLTWFIRLIKGVMLKGYTSMDLLPDVLPLLIMTVVVIFIGLRTYGKTIE